MSLTQRLLSGSGGLSSRLLNRGAGSKRRQPPSLRELQQREAELTAMQQEYGARDIEQDKPGVFRTLVDILSRPNYAMAGATEEILSGNSVTSAVGRMLSEIFSGVGPVQGKKRAFGEVLENLGVGTVTLADAIPALEGTWVGNFGSRGAAGLALDIFTDPLTYLTFGTGTGTRYLSKEGTKFLSKAGTAKWLDVQRSLYPKLKEAMSLTDDYARRMAVREVDDAAHEAFEKVLTPDMLEPGGAKLFGKQIPGTAEVARILPERVRSAVMAVPGGERALEGAKAFSDGFKKMLNGIFSPHGPLADAPPALRDWGVKMHRDFVTSKTVHAARLHTVARGLEAKFNALVKTEEQRLALGKKLYQVKEGKLPESALTPAEKEIYDGVSEMYGGMWRTANEAGVLDDAQRREAYFFHRYQNERDDFSEVWAAYTGSTPGQGAKFTKERVFDSYDDAVEVSRELNKLSREINDRYKAAGLNRRVPEYPVLEPDYDLFKNLNAYIEQHSAALYRKAWYEEAAKRFGIDVADYDLDVLYELSEQVIKARSRREILGEIDKIQSFVNRSKGRPTGQIAKADPGFDVDTLTPANRPVPLSQADPDSPVMSRLRSIDDEIERTRETLNPQRDGYGDLTPGAKRLAIKRLNDLEVERKALSEKVGRALYKEQIGAAEARLAELRAELKTRDVSELHQIELFFDGKSSFKSLADDAGRSVEDPAKDVAVGGMSEKETLAVWTRSGKNRGTEKVSGRTKENAQKIIDEANRLLGRLSDDGKREFLRRLLVSSKSSADSVTVLRGVDKRFMEFLPAKRAIKEGAVDSANEALGPYVLRTGELWGKPVLIPKAIADDIERFNTKLLNTRDYEGFRKLLRGFDWMNNWFKIGAYTLWPASATRDAYSNVALSMLDIGVGAMSPRAYWDAGKVLAGMGDDIVIDGVRWSPKQLRTLAEDMNVIVPGEVFAELTQTPDAKWGVTKLQRGFRKATRARGQIENEARVVLWLQNIRRGMDPRAAADQVQQFLFNYGELSQVEREVFRRFIPFYTFTRKNVGLQAKAIRETPGRVINQIKPFRGREDENEQMVQFRGEALKLRLNRDGKTVQMLNGIDLPLRNLDILWRGSARKTLRMQLGMLTPVIKTVFETATGRDFFLGKDLDRTTSPAMGRAIEPLPNLVKDWLGWKKEVNEVGRPRYTFDGERFNLLFRSWMFSRMVSTADRQFREYVDEGGFTWWKAATDILSGIRPEVVDLTKEQERRVYERIRQLEEVGRRRGYLRDYTRSYTPREVGELR